MANELEDALGNMGFSFADSPDEFKDNVEETPTEEEQPQEEVVAEDAPVESEAPQESESSLQEETVSEEAPMQEEPVEEQIEETQPEEVNDEMILSAVSETLGVQLTSMEELQGLLNKEQTSEIDPAVQAIADFVSETGRSVDDWFAYQSFNPSEMDDMAVMMTKIKSDNPEISNEDAQLLLESRYTIDEDLHSENEIRLGKLNLKMDAGKARTELESLRESYKAPVQQESTSEGQEELESPLTEEWIGAMSSTVDEIESLEIDIAKDKSFSFGLNEDYKSTLKSKNAKLDEYFDAYVDDKGNWDFDTLSAHRAIIDNIDEIAKSIYAQGLSDGQSEVVKEAVNPSSPNPQGSNVDASSAADKVRKQVLDAMSGGDDKLRFKI